MAIELVYSMHSVCNITNTRISTFILEFPRAMLAELLTHRVFARNTSSTRAIPIERAVELTNANPYIPEWTTNKPGMIGDPLTDENTASVAELRILELLEITSQVVASLGLPKDKGGLNIHKQDAGRYLEPWQYVRMVVTTTELENFLWLRDDLAAYPPIRKVAQLIAKDVEQAVPVRMTHGMWHLPGIDREVLAMPDGESEMIYYHPDTNEIMQLEEAQELSMSLMGQTSFRRNDTSPEKTQKVTKQLLKGDKVHASPSEHQATPFSVTAHTDALKLPAGSLNIAGLSGVDTSGRLQSGNLRNWCQLRQLLPNHDKALF